MIFLHIDLILSALIGPEGAPIERFIADAKCGKQQLAILELALYCAVCSLQPGDQVNLPRFARLLQFGQIVQSPKPFNHPTQEEITHWRDVVFGRESDE